MPQNNNILNLEYYKNLFYDKSTQISDGKNIEYRFNMRNRECKIGAEEAIHSFKMYEILEGADCEINNYLIDKIKGVIKINPKEKYTVSWYIEQYLKECKEDDKEVITDVCEPIIEW